LNGHSDKRRSLAVVIPRVAVVAVCLLSGSPLGAAETAPPGSQLQGEERARIIQRLLERQRDVTTVRATVVQRKRHPLLQAEAVSEGTLLFQRPNRMRWEVEKPEHVILLMDGHTLLTYRPARKEAERRDLRDDFGTRAAVEFLTSGMSLALTDLEARFQVDLFREDGGVVLLLTPRSRWVAQAVASVAIHQREADAVPRRIVVVGRKGDRTETTLTDVSVNPQLPENPFTLRLGPEVRVTEIRQPGSETGSDR
jgi:outer membrane lipoprotein-sorting protein